MRILLTSIFLLAGAWAIHLLIWRIRLPKHHIPALLGIFAIFLCGWVGIAITRGVPLPNLVSALMLYGSMSLCYVITYSAIEGDSPTLSLIRELDKAGKKGLGPNEIERFVADRPFVKTRLDALIHSGLVRKETERYRICGRPPLFFRVILGFRKLYGPIAKGG